MVATPGDPGNGVPVDELEGDVAVDIVYAGSCTGAKWHDMEMAAEVVEKALAEGRQVPDRSRRGFSTVRWRWRTLPAGRVTTTCSSRPESTCFPRAAAPASTPAPA